MDNTGIAPVTEGNQPSVKQTSPFLFFIMGIVIASLVISTLLTKSNKSSSLNKSVSQTKRDIKEIPITNKQWINCSDVRDILEEGEKMYVACLGGVVIINKSTGEVLDQITMTQRLGNNVTTSLVKQENDLYIGTQDGFTKFNLKTRQAKKISVKEGLISGANIYLALDGDNLWIGTFEGLNLYDTKTGSISTFTKEVADNASKYGVNKIIITPRAVYTLALANVDAPGAVARFDKATKTWERFGPSAFLASIDQYSRIDMYDIANNGDKIYLTDMNHVWQTEDVKGASWKKVETIEQGLKNIQNPYIRRMFANNNTFYMLVNDYIYSFNNDILKKVYPPIDNQNIFTNTAGNQPIYANKSLYATTTDGWVVGLDTESLKPFTIILKNRPIEFGSFLAKIDDSIFFCSSKTVWEYNKTGLFKNHTDVTCPSNNLGNGINTFIPIPNSNEIFTFSQECGMNCGKPQIAILNYEDSSVKPQTMPSEYMRALKGTMGEWDYPALMFKQYDTVNKQIIFTLNTNTDNNSKTIKIPFDLKTFNWDPGEIETTTDTQNLTLNKPCNPLYAFETNNKKFTSIDCKETASNGEYTFFLQETAVDKEGYKKIYNLAKENIKTKEITKLDFPKGADLPYSPFGTSFYSTGFNKLTLVNNRVFIPSNTGMFIYDVKGGTWKVLTTKDGLTSNNVTDYIVDTNYLWAITEWGGLSKISLP